MTIVLILGVTSFCFAKNEFQIKGTLININGNMVIVKDDKGKEINIETSVSGIKVGDSVLLKGELFKVDSLRTELTPQDIEFLTNQCRIDQADVTVIPQLEERTRMKLFSWIDRNDCNLFKTFKDSRTYFKQLKPKTRLPMPPAGWDTHFLTVKEFEQYSDIIANAPW